MIDSGGDPDVSAKAVGHSKSYIPATRHRKRADEGSSAGEGALVMYWKMGSMKLSF
jgi:hypothetical protein